LDCSMEECSWPLDKKLYAMIGEIKKWEAGRWVASPCGAPGRPSAACELKASQVTERIKTH